MLHAGQFPTLLELIPCTTLTKSPIPNAARFVWSHLKSETFLPAIWGGGGNLGKQSLLAQPDLVAESFSTQATSILESTSSMASQSSRRLVGSRQPEGEPNEPNLVDRNVYLTEGESTTVTVNAGDESVYVRLQIGAGSLGHADIGFQNWAYVHANGSVELSIDAVADGIFEGLQSAPLILQVWSSGGWVDVDSGTIQVQDTGGSGNDNDSTVVLSPSIIDVTEGETVDIDVTAGGLTGFESIRFTIQVEPNPTASTNDYSYVVSDFLLSAGDPNTTIRFEAIADSLVENTEAVFLTARHETTTGGIAYSPPIRINILDSQVIIPNITSVSSPTVTEGETASVEVQLDQPTNAPMNISVMTTSGTAIGGTDYENVNQQFVIPNDVQSFSIPVLTHPDSIDENNETFSVTVTNDARSSNELTGTVTITEPVRVSIESLGPVNEGSDSRFRIFTSSTNHTGFTVRFQTENETAVASQDYQSLNQLITFGPGQSSVVIDVPTIDNTIAEPTEQFRGILSQATNGITIASASDDGVIVDSDQATIRIEDAIPVFEGQQSRFQIVASGFFPGTGIYYNLGTQDLSATATNDYQARNSGLSSLWADSSGNAITEVTVPTFTDQLYEGTEEFQLDISNVSLSNNTTTNWSVTRSTAQGTIVDANSAPTFDLSDAEATEGDELVFNLTTTGQFERPIRVNYNTYDDTAFQPDDYRQSNGSFFIQPTSSSPNGSGQFQTNSTIRVPTFTDDLTEERETMTLRVSPHLEYNSLTLWAAGDIIDAPAAPKYTLRVEPDQSGEGDPVSDESQRQEIRYRVSIDPVPEPGDTVSVDYHLRQLSTADGVTTSQIATAGADWVHVTEDNVGRRTPVPFNGTQTQTRTLTFVAGAPAYQTLIAPIVGDLAIEQDEQFAANLFNPTVSSTSDPGAFAEIEEEEARGTIQDDDSGPQLSIVPLTTPLSQCQTCTCVCGGLSESIDELDGTLSLAVPFSSFLSGRPHDQRQRIGWRVENTDEQGDARLGSVSILSRIAGQDLATLNLTETDNSPTSGVAATLNMESLTQYAGSAIYQIDVSATATGGGVSSRSFSERYHVPVVDANDFGLQGWRPAGVHRLIPVIDVDGNAPESLAQSDGLGVVDGSGIPWVFEPAGASGYRSPAGNENHLSRTADGFVLAKPDGTRLQFDADGTHQSTTDRHGNTTGITYTGGKVTSITDAFGRDTTFVYDASGNLDTITDDAGLTYDFQISSGKLTGLGLPDPDGSGPLTAPVWQFQYVTGRDEISRTINPLGGVTRYEYDFTGDEATLREIHRPDGSVTDLQPAIRSVSLDVGGPLSSGGVRNAALENISEFRSVSTTDGVTTQTAIGPLGRPTSMTRSDGFQRTIDYTSDGWPERIEESSPDGGTVLYQWTYDDRGRPLTRTTTATDRQFTERWTYDEPTGQVRTYQDPLGRLHAYELDASGNMNSETRLVEVIPSDPRHNDGATLGAGDNPDDQFDVNRDGVVDQIDVGEVAACIWPNYGTTSDRYDFNDDGYLSATDILQILNFVQHGTPIEVAAATWTTAASAVPAGLPETQTDRNGLVTRYRYNEDSSSNHFGLLTSMTVGEGLPEARTWTYHYDDRRNPSKIVDPIGREFLTDYDALGRLTRQQLRDTSGNLVQDERYQYNGNNQRTQTIDGVGRISDYIYNAAGQLLEERLPVQTGRARSITKYEYTDEGRLDKTIDPLGRTTRYLYTDGQLSTIIPPARETGQPLPTIIYEINDAGYVTDVHQYDNTGQLIATQQTTYDHAGRVVATASPNSDSGDEVRRESVYDNAGRLIRTVTGTGEETVYRWDGLDRMYQRVDPIVRFRWFDHSTPEGLYANQAVYATTFFHDPAGHPTAVVDPRGARTQHTLNAFGEITATVHPDPDGDGPRLAATESFVRDDVGRVEVHTGITGLITSRILDAADRPLSQAATDPQSGIGSDHSWIYDQAGRLTRQTDPLGVTTNYVYDASFDSVRSRSLSSYSGTRTQTWTFDVGGRTTSTTTPNGAITTYGYDNHDNVTSTAVTPQNASGTSAFINYDEAVTTQSRFDDAGRRVYHRDINGAATSSTYYLNGSLRTTQQPGLGIVTHTYDAAGRPETLTDGLGNTTTWTYDVRGLLSEETDQQNFARTFHYDDAGDLTRRIDRDGRRIDHQRDNLGLITKESWHDSNGVQRDEITFAYDVAGRLTGADHGDTTIVHSYDAFGNLERESTDVAGFDAPATLAYTYDSRQLLTARTLGIDGDSAVIDRLVHNGFGETTIVDRMGLAGGQQGRVWISLRYDNVGRLQSLDRWISGSSSGYWSRPVSTNYGYSPGNRILSVSHNATGHGVVAQHDVGYRYSGGTLQQRASRSGNQVVDQTISRAHDAAGQLILDASTTVDDETFNYDYDDAGNREQHTIGVDNTLWSDGEHQYGYDQEGQRLARTRLDGTEHVTYRWDHRGRLIGVTTYAGSSIAAPQTRDVQYTYDALDRRVAKVVVENGNEMVAERMIQDGDDTLAVTDRDGNVRERIMHGPMVDQVLVEERYDAAGSNRQVLLPLGDHQNTVETVAVWDDVLRRFDDFATNEIDVWGKESDPSDAISRYGYTGRDRDAETDLQYNRARYYDPVLGRWISKDPSGLDPDSNPYRYVRNQPTTLTDPSGLEPPQLSPAQVDELINNQTPLIQPNSPYGGIRLGAHGNGLPAGAYGPSRQSTRPLTPGELAMLNKFFGENLDTDGLCVGIGKLHPFAGGNSITPRYTPWFPKSNYAKDFSQTGDWREGHFIHEMTHVLQSQNGNWNVADFGYQLLRHKFFYGQTYLYDLDDLGQPLYMFNFEQQAAIAEHYYRGGRYGVKFDNETMERCRQTLEGFHTQLPAFIPDRRYIDSRHGIHDNSGWGYPHFVPKNGNGDSIPYGGF